MSKPNLMVMYPLRDGAMGQIEQRYTTLRYDLAPDKSQFLREHGAKCRAVVINGHTPLTADDIAAMPNLELVSCVSAGFDSFDIDALRNRGIHLTNTSVALLDDVADMAILLMLAAQRDLVAAHHYVTSGEWGKRGMYPLQSSLRGKHVGIVGLGTIGQAIAARAAPMGVTLAYYNRRPKEGTELQYFESLLDLADWADILIVAVPGGPETRNLISTDTLMALGPNGILVNIARGTVVDETALIQALTQGHLGRAALDVYLNEPNPNPDLVNLAGVTLYPHHASGTVETRDAMAQLAVDNLDSFFAGRPLLTPVF